MRCKRHTCFKGTAIFVQVRQYIMKLNYCLLHSNWRQHLVAKACNQFANILSNRMVRIIVETWSQLMAKDETLLSHGCQELNVFPRMCSPTTYLKSNQNCGQLCICQSKLVVSSTICLKKWFIRHSHSTFSCVIVIVQLIDQNRQVFVRYCWTSHLSISKDGQLKEYRHQSNALINNVAIILNTTDGPSFIAIAARFSTAA